MDDIKPYIMEWYYLDHIELQEISRRLQYSKRQIQRIKQESEHELGLAAGWCIVGFKITAMHVEKKGQSNEE